jgi:pimeloyl-ACP methyl ester carboxylesterase
MTKSRYSTLSQVKLHYLEEGEGNVVVLLHGWPQTSHSWRHVIQTLTEISGGRARHAGIGGQLAPGCRI